MNEEERLSLNNYIEDLYQAMQIGDIIFDSNHSNELYNLINKLLKENQQLKDVINKANKKIDNMFEVGDENKIIDDLLELQKILDNKGE